MPWDETLLVWLNQLLALNQQTFFAGLFLADRVPLVLSAMVIVGLWYTGKAGNLQPQSGQLSRHDSRWRVLLIFLSTVIAFMLARWLSGLLFRPAPLLDVSLQVPIDPHIWAGIVEQFRGSGAFPSDHAAFWFALTAGLFTYNWRAGLTAGLASLFFSALRVGVGYHYPSDMVAGACLGILILVGVFSMRSKLTWVTHPTLRFFEKTSVVAYPLGLLLMLDITQRMAWLFGLLATLLGIRGVP